VTGRVRFGRRAFVAGAVSAGVGLAGCESGPPPRVALHRWPGYEFMRLAGRAVPSGSAVVVDTATVQQSLAMLADGSADGAGLTLDQVLGARETGLDLGVALVFDISSGADAVLARPGIGTLAGLRGRAIGVEKSTLGAVMIAKALEAGGLRRTDLTVVDMDEDHVAAWERGGLDAIITYEPSLARLRASGLRSIFDSRSLPRLIVDVLAVRRGLSGRRADGLRELVAGHFEFVDEWRQSPADLAYRLATMLSTSAEEIAESYRGIDLPDAVYNRRYLTPPAAEMTAAAHELAGILRETGAIARPLSTEGLFLANFLPRAR